MPMPVIRVSDETFRRLQSWAEPLKDSSDDALNRVLDIAEEARRQDLGASGPASKSEHPLLERRPHRRRRVTKLPQSAYREPILEVLGAMGGRGSMPEILDLVKGKVEHLLGPTDHERLPSGNDIRWRNTAAWERFQMVKEGLMKKSSPRGIWELTEKGIGEAERLTRAGN